MQYRLFGRTGKDVSILGFGCMRLPIIDGDSSKIDQEKTDEMLHYAIDNGVNYVDTAYPYHQGQSEIAVGKALKNGYREKVFLATKLPVWLVKKETDTDDLIDEQLKKLDTDHIDMYLLHALGKARWEDIKRLNILDHVKKAKAAGKIRNIGFSFHDKLDVFKEIVDSFDWDFCQIQYNFLDVNNQAGTEGLKYAAAKGIPVVIMEPLRGGKLAGNPPASIQDIYDASGRSYSPVEWSLRWIYNHSEVNVVLSGMSTFEQVKDNIRIASESLANSLSPSDEETILKVSKEYKNLMKVNCTSCEYCMPCPAGVNIPRNFGMYNDASMFNRVKENKEAYLDPSFEKLRASQCVKCGKCEKVCPQKINIRNMLCEVNQVFSE